MTLRRFALSVLILGILAGGWLPAGESPDQPAWTRDLGGKIIAVVNASPGMFSAVPGPQELSLAQGTMGYVPSYGGISFKDLCEGYKQGGVRLLETTSGLLVLMVEDRDDAVRLVGLDTESGAVRWECPGLTVGKQGGFLALGSLALLRLERDEQGKPPDGKTLWVSINLRDGRRLWRNTDVAGDWADILCLPDQRLALIRAYSYGLGGGDAGCLSAIQLDTGRTLWRIEADRAWGLRLPLLDSAGSNWTVFPSPVYQTPENFAAALAGGDDLTLSCFTGKHMVPVVQSRDLATGRPRWEYPVDKDTHAAALAVSDDAVYAFCFETIVVLDRATGAQRARWAVPNEKNTGGVKGDPDHPRILHLDGDLLLVHCPGGKRYQLKAFDVKSGRQLWEANQFREAVDSIVVAGDRLVLWSARAATVLDKRTGAVVGSFAPKFEEAPATLASGGEGRIILQTKNQLALFQADPWKEVFNTGAMPKTEAALPPREKVRGVSLLDVISASPSFGLTDMVGAASRVIDERQRALKLDATLRPSGQKLPGESAAARPGGGEIGTSDPAHLIRALAGLSDGLATRDPAGAGGAASFFLSEVPAKGRQLLRVNLATGEKQSAQVSDPGEWRNTVVDDFRGINCQVGKEAVAGYRYSLAEARRQRAQFLEALAAGAGALARAAALGREQRSGEAADTWASGERLLRAALDAASSTDEQAAARLRLAAAYLWRIQAGAGAAPDLAEKLHAELAAVAASPVCEGDAWLRAAVDFAAAASRAGR